MSKQQTRRQFLKKGVLAATALPLVGSGLMSMNSPLLSTKAVKPLKILILGGTSYLGPHQIAYALKRGHSVSTFTRGKTIPKIHPEVFKNVEQLIGDREYNLTVLENRQWDVVIDNSGRRVQWTKDTAQLLKDNVSMYMYTSSTGVYYPYLKGDLTEDTPLVLETPDHLSEDEKYEQDYGVMKANSELEAIRAFGKDRTIVIRPTYMLGPGDRTNRFLHWPLKLSQGGTTLVPGKKEDLVQYIDVRDVAEWFIRLAENKTSGIFNGVGPKSEQTILEFVKAGAKVFNKEINPILVDDYDFLKKQQVLYAIPWVMADKTHYGSARTSTKNALAGGIQYRSLEATFKDTLNWWQSDAVDPKRKAAYESNSNEFHNREQALLDLWKAYKK
ncbi:NAD-dependent epimerase/dehydratase family protein [Winogradskyella aurantiaca]|uniref:NAD-dependent epimerase/dehydratase family protein n=1 Tax=Winogradskyella aurantiaca TaxID=2219558 RepID=UPI000E1CC49E|nr:NAD-dependent epimerase/dehydratase family protein [Winogradskyella aurantiaca]